MITYLAVGTVVAAVAMIPKANEGTHHCGVLLAVAVGIALLWPAFVALCFVIPRPR